MKRALVFLLAVAGCDAVLGIEELPRGTPPPLSYVEEACDRCVQESCAAAEESCLADDACRSLHACLARCPVDTPRCRRDCELLADGGIAEPLARALDTCRRQACTLECLGLGGLVDQLAPDCAACAPERCADESRACIAMAEANATWTDPQVGYCERWLACITQPLDPDAVEACLVAAPGPDVVATNLANCAADRCDCSYGRDWSCVGKYAWVRTQGTTSVNIRFRDLALPFETSGVANAHVRACTPGTCGECLLTTDEGFTDEGGRIPLELRAPAGDVTACFHIEADGYMPYQWTVGRPLNRSGLSWGFDILGRDDFAAALSVLGLVPVEERGHLGVVVRDCGWQFAPGVSATLMTGDDEVFQAYWGSDFYDLEATATSRSGVIAFLNVLPGEHRVVFTHEGETVATANIGVEAGGVTVAQVWPDTELP